MRIVQFLGPPTPYPSLSIYVKNSSTTLTLDAQFQTNPPPLFPNDKQSIKKSMIQRWLFYVTRSFLQVGIRFQLVPTH